MCPPLPSRARKVDNRKLEVRYDNTVQTIDLDAAATEALWVSLSLDGEGLSQSEREKMIQDEWNEQYNKPDYNNWHKFWRHHGDSKAQPGKDDTEDDVDTSEPMMKEVTDDRVFRQDEIKREEKESYEDICQWVRKVLIKKPHWAEAFISVRLDEMSVNDYAASIGVSDVSVVSKWLARAEKKLQEKYQNRQI